MNARAQVIRALTRVTRRRAPIQLLSDLLRERLLHRGLGLDLSYNCVYREEVVVEALVYASLTGLALEMGCDRLRSLGCHSPTGHAVRDKLRAKTVDEGEQEASRLIQGMGRVIDGPVTLALTAMRPGEKPHQVLKRLLNRVEGIVRVGRVLADAGFYPSQSPASGSWIGGAYRGRFTVRPGVGG